MHLATGIYMISALAILFVSVAAVLAVPADPQRIAGGSLTTVSSYPYVSSLLYSSNLVTYSLTCGGTILTTKTILSTASCVYGVSSTRFRIRVGSSYAHSGGYVHNLLDIIIHPSYNDRTWDADVALLKTTTSINYITGAVQPATIAGTYYNLPDNEPVVAIGWGATYAGRSISEQLRQFQVWTVQQATCRSSYAALGNSVTDNTLCSGWLNVGGRGQCKGDGGSPLIHNNVIVGISSWGVDCAIARYPDVNTRVSRFADWIVAFG